MNKRSQNKIDYQALAQFRYEIRRFINFSEQAARDAGMEPQQHQALLAIEGLPATHRATIGVLAERLQIQHHSAVGLVDRLEAERLLRRTSSRADRREVLLRVTRRGTRLLNELSLSHRAELRGAGRALLRALETAMTHANGAGESRPQTSASRQNRRAKEVRKK
ncbi:MAG TPA: helix-turn-helix domain-containing protein [Candidatus Acidoferrales bacterium]|nr:helix-turn-helix domain-containing protein [Candidatus Acidoferrales bacterium]